MTNCALRNCLLLPVTVGVCATLILAQTSPTTRIEEADKSITYRGNWYTNDSSFHSGGRAALTNAIGATAVVTFTGTGITWIGIVDPWAGMATVYLDGTRNTVDTYGNGTLYQRALFKVSGLASGPHTLSIEVTHTRDANGQGSWVWIDAFDVENGTGVTGGVTASTGRTEQNNPALTYTGVWFPNTSTVQSGGSAVLATDAGSRATINFNGTGVTWIAYGDQWSGIARIYVDGLLTGTVDTYLSPSQAQSAVYVINGLVSGTHTLTIEVTGTHNPLSGGSWIWVDGFDVVGSASQAVPAIPAAVSPSDGIGVSQMFTFMFSYPADWENLASAAMLINNVLDPRHACFVKFVPSAVSSGSVFLADDAGAMGGPDSAMPLPGSGSMSNSQCTVNAAGSSMSWDGNALTLKLPITFSASFAGNKVMFLAAQDKSPTSTGWRASGAWVNP